MAGNRAIVVDSSDESDREGNDQESSFESGDEKDLVDDEAEEVAREDEKSFFWRSNNVSFSESFHQFSRFPPEIRERVWQMYCRDLILKARLIKFGFSVSANDRCLIEDDMALSDQTRELRIVSAVHRESRHLVVKKFPDTIDVHAGQGDALVRFNSAQDICCFAIIEWASNPRQIVTASNKIRHVAIEWQPERYDDDYGLALDDYPDIMAHALEHFPHAKTIFLNTDHQHFLGNIRWTGSQMACHARIQTFEKEPGLGEDYEWVYAWPDMTNHPDFNLIHVIKPFCEDLAEELLEKMASAGVTVAPILRFEGSDVTTFDRLVEETEQGIPLDEDDRVKELRSEESEDSRESSPNEYESEGIDDSEIVEDDESSEDELIPRPISAGGSDADEAREGRFSSPELEMNGESTTRASTVPRGSKRRVVPDSEDESDDAPVAKRPRREAPIAISSDDDQDVAPKARSRSTPQVVISSSDEDDEGDDNDQPPATLSLAERLQRFRDEVPVSPNDDDSGDGDGLGYNDFDEDNDSDDTDDDEEDDTGRRGGGFIDDMAEDSEEDDEEDEEEYDERGNSDEAAW